MGAIYVECSSKEMTGVHEVFELAVNTAIGVEEKGYFEPVEGNGPTSNGSNRGGVRKSKIKKRTCKIL